MSGERLERWTDRHGPVLALAIAIVGGLIGMFNRSLAYHDEILNTNKAMQDIVLDYAMRPVFYGLNVVAMKIFGNHTYAMVILSVLSLGITALLIYYICVRFSSSRLGLLAVLVFVGVNMVRDFGVRAMAHMHAGMFMTLSLYCALLCFSDERPGRQRLWGLATGLLAIVSFSTHPTMAGYLVGLCFFAAITWLLYLVPSTRQSPLALRIRPALWIAIGVAAALLTLMAIYAIWYKEAYLSAWLRFAKIPQGTPAEKGLSLYYVRTLVVKGALPFIFLGLSLLVAFAGKLVGRGKAGANPMSRYQAFALAMPLFCLVLGAAMISLNQWKHGRIVVSYVPLVVLSFACWLALAGDVVERILPPRWARFLVLFVVVLLTVRSVRGVQKHARQEAKQSHFQRSRYLSLYEALRNIPDRRIGLLVGPGKLGTKASFVYAAGLTMRALPSLPEVIAMSDEDLESELRSLRVRYIYWDLASTTPAEYNAIATKLLRIGGSAIHNWRGLREVWLVRVTSTTFKDTLSTLANGTKVGVFGEEAELSSETNYTIRTLLEGYKLGAYILNANRRSAARQLYYLARNKVDYVILPAAADNQISAESIAAMQAVLESVGARMVEEAGQPGLQLWHLPDRQRAAAAAEN